MTHHRPSARFDNRGRRTANEGGGLEAVTKQYIDRFLSAGVYLLRRIGGSFGIPYLELLQQRRDRTRVLLLLPFRIRRIEKSPKTNAYVQIHAHESTACQDIQATCRLTRFRIKYLKVVRQPTL